MRTVREARFERQQQPPNEAAHYIRRRSPASELFVAFS